MAKRNLKKRSKQKKYRSKSNIPFWKQRAFLFPLVAVLAITAAIFLPSLSHGFVNWDDELNIHNNLFVQELTWSNIQSIFSREGTIIGNYNPMPLLTFALEYHFVKLDPFVYHLNNLLLHLICVFFVYRISLQLGLGYMGAALVALLFGIHPMRVESVVWVTERKDVLFGAFYLAGMFTYIKYLKTPKQRLYLITMLLFIFSLLSKIQAVAFPLTMVLLDYFYKKPQRWKLVPFFVLSAITGIMGIIFLGEDGSLENEANYTIFQRLLIGDYSYLTYLYKLIFPYPMSPLYPYPKVLTWGFYAAPIGTLGIAALLYWAYQKGYRILLFAFAFFTFNVMFVLQILGAGQGFLADRFTYIPYFGFFFLAGWGLERLLKLMPKQKAIISAAFSAFLVLFVMMTFQQAKIWENSQTLWSHCLKFYQNINTPFINIGHYYRDKGDFEKAHANYSKALELKVRPETYNSRGKLQFEQGKGEAALADFNAAIQMGGRPETIGEIYINRGAVFGSKGDYDRALDDFSKGIELHPTQKNGYANRSMIYFLRQQYDLALQDYNSYIALNPMNAKVWYERGLTHHRLNNTAGALSDLNRAIQLNPNNGTFYRKRGDLHAALGNASQATQDHQRAQQLGK